MLYSTLHTSINSCNLIVKSSWWRLDVPFYDWKPYIHPISNTFSIVRPLSSLSVLHTRNYKGKERSFILLPPNLKFNFVEIHRKSDLSFLRHAAFSKNPKLRKETKRLKVNYNIEDKNKIRCTQNLVLQKKQKAEAFSQDQPGSRHKSSYRISWRRSAHQKENTRRLSHMMIYKSQEVSIRLVHCTKAWP